VLQPIDITIDDTTAYTLTFEVHVNQRRFAATVLIELICNESEKPVPFYDR
jgi:hypothetical protein